MPQILSAQKQPLPSSRTRHLLFQRLDAFWRGCLSAGGAQGWHAAPQSSSSFLNSLTLENKMQTCFLVLVLFSGTLPQLQFPFSSYIGFLSVPGLCHHLEPPSTAPGTAGPDHEHRMPGLCSANIPQGRTKGKQNFKPRISREGSASAISRPAERPTSEAGAAGRGACRLLARQKRPQHPAPGANALSGFPGKASMLSGDFHRILEIC